MFLVKVGIWSILPSMNPALHRKKVLVTGANGMLGSAICHQLFHEGYEVCALCFPGSSVKTIENLSLEIQYGNILDIPFIKTVMGSCQFVIHVAALTDMWPKRNNRVMEVNLTGTKNIAAIAEEIGIERMIYIGSASSFQPGSRDRPGTELNRFNGWHQGLDYIDSKYMAQEMLIEKHQLSGFPCVVINPTFMIGPFDSLPSSGKVLLGLYHDRLPGYTTGGKNFVYSFDVATAAVNALQMGRTGECYIAGAHNLTYREFLTKACQVMNKDFKLWPIPDWAVKSLGKMTSISAVITGKPPLLTYELAKISTKFHGFDSGKAVRELNMPQTSIEEAIAASFNWFKENGYTEGKSNHRR